MSRRWVLPLALCGTLVASACSRQADSAPPLDPAFTVPTAVRPEAEILQPIEGDTVSSPFEVVGRAPVGEGRTVAVQVKTRGPDGEWRWIGNSAMDVGDDGRFEGEVTYTLVEAAPGALQLVLVDEETGAVLESVEFPIELEPSP